MQSRRDCTPSSRGYADDVRSPTGLHTSSTKFNSQDPIGLLSGEPNFYAYVHDNNSWVNIFGLAKTCTITYNHKQKPSKVTGIIDLKKQIRQQLKGMNKILREEGIEGLKDRIRKYNSDSKIEELGRAFTKSLGSAGEGKVWLHVPDMKTGGLPTDIAKKAGLERANSIIGGNVNRISNEILDMVDDVVKLKWKLIIVK